MPHEISNINGVDEFFYYGETPWHGLGTRVDAVLTAEEAIKAAHLDWRVEKKKVYFRADDNSYVETNAFATVRTDIEIPLGIVSERYIPIQNHEAFSFADALVASREAKYITAGSIFQGKKIFLLCQLPGHISIISKGYDDKVLKYLLLVNSHDGNGSLKALLTGVRVVCNNTLTLALKNAPAYISIHHTGNIRTKISEAQRVLGISIDYFKLMQEVFSKFSGYSITEGEARQFFTDIIPDTSKRAKNTIATIEGFYHDGRGAEIAKNTLWGAYNAVVEYVDHHRINYEENPDRYLYSNIFGSGLDMKEKAFMKAYEISCG